MSSCCCIRARRSRTSCASAWTCASNPSATASSPALLTKVYRLAAANKTHYPWQRTIHGRGDVHTAEEEANIFIVRRGYAEVLDRTDPDAVDALIAPDYIQHNPSA